MDQVAAMDVDFTTDHTVLNFNILLKTSEKPSVSRKVFNYKKTDVGKLCALLSDLPYFNTATDVTNIDAAWDTWLQHYNKSVSECVQQVNVRKSNAPPWFDSEVRHMSSKKNNVWKIAKASDLKEDWDKFKKIRNKLKSVLRKKYRCFVDNLGEMSKSNPKRFWTFFRNKTKSKSLPCKIQNDSAGSADPQSKACLFNDYFKSVFKQVDEREQVPGMTGPPSSFTARGPVTLTAILFPQPAV